MQAWVGRTSVFGNRGALCFGRGIPPRLGNLEACERMRGGGVREGAWNMLNPSQLKGVQEASD